MKTVLLSVLAIFSLTIAKAQTADEIISKHIDVLGGKDKLSQINSIYMESIAEVMGTQAPSKTYIVNGKGFKTESDFNGQNIVTTLTDKGGWAINPFAGSSSATAMPDEEYQLRADDLYAVDPLVNYSANGGKVELQGQEKVGDIDAFKLKYTNKYNHESTYYVDPSTWYVIKVTTQANVMGQSTDVTTTFSEYKPTDTGVVMPYAMNVDMGQFALAMTVSKIEINKEIDPAIFEMPK